MKIKNLNEARAAIEALEANAVSLEKLTASLAEAGIEAKLDEDGKYAFAFPAVDAKLSEVEAKLAEVSKLQEESAAVHAKAIEELNATIEAKTAETVELTGKLDNASRKIVELEEGQKSVSAQARELLASQGGKPLAAESSEEDNLTVGELVKAIEAETDSKRRFALYKQFKAKTSK